MNTRSRLSVSSVVLLVGAVTTACGGGGGGAPADASKDDFCAAQASLFESFDIDLTDPEAAVPDEKDMAEALHDWADELEKVGTPEDISDDARKGFEETIKQAGDISEADLKSPDLDALQEEMSEDAKANAEAFNTYVTDTCGSMLGDIEMPELPE
jgi:hypothetical protein